MDDLFWVGTSIGLFVYPVLVAFYALWGSRKILKTGPSGFHYIWGGLKLSLIPPLVAALLMVFCSGLHYQGTCPGWLDSGPRPCPVQEYLLVDLFWTAMILFVPGLIGLGLTLVIFIWQWITRKPLSTDNQPRI